MFIGLIVKDLFSADTFVSSIFFFNNLFWAVLSLCEDIRFNLRQQIMEFYSFTYECLYSQFKHAL